MLIILHHDRAPMGEFLAPNLERPRHIGKREFRLLLQADRQVGGGLLERRRGLGGEHKQMIVAHRNACGGRGSLLDHDMGIGAADAEGTDTRPARRISCGPRRPLGAGHEWAARQIQLRVR